MTWFKVDDSFYRHRKVRKLGRERVRVAIKVAAAGLWTLSGDHAADNLTDGFVPWEVIEQWDPRRVLAHKLITVGLWDVASREGEQGIQFHDWDDYQPSRDQVVQRRKVDAERKARWRESRKESRQESRRDSERPSQRPSRQESQGESRKESVLPDPTRPEKKESPGGDSRPRKRDRDPDPDRFDEFWSAYPRRVQKRRAEQAWNAALGRGADPSALVDAAARFATAVADRDLRYVPHPASWLNSGAYDDEPEPPQKRNHRKPESGVDRNVQGWLELGNNHDHWNPPQLPEGTSQ